MPDSSELRRPFLIGLAIVIIIAGIVNSIAGLFFGHGILNKFANIGDPGYDLVLGFFTLFIGYAIYNNI